MMPRGPMTSDGAVGIQHPRSAVSEVSGAGASLAISGISLYWLGEVSVI
jgi:hypothetical protein